MVKYIFHASHFAFFSFLLYTFSTSLQNKQFTQIVRNAPKTPMMYDSFTVLLHL